eukprot:ANDGO_04251.mRNA.1 Cochlin OS=Gallus gallus GN=COCH PE=2 SV=1
MGLCCCCCKKPDRKCTDYTKGASGFFFCPKDCPYRNSGSVWGSGPYTSDSCSCRAARHAGVIGDNGGVYKVSTAPGQASYESTTANGVTTSSYGSYDSSISVSRF